MNMSLKQLQAFVKVAQSKSYADAATQLYLSQPALSIAIKNLEQNLGGSLLNRSTRKVELTPEGLVFFPVARRLLQDYEEAFEDLQGLFSLQKGKLSLAVMPSFASGILPYILRDFSQTFPNITIAVQDVVMESVISSVLSSRAEIGFTFEASRMNGLSFVALFENDFIVLCDESNQLAKEQALTWSTLNEQPFVAMNRGSTIRHWIDQTCQEKAINLNVVAEAGQLGTLGEFVAVGLGVSVVPALCRAQMKRKGLICIPLKDSGISKKIGVITKNNSSLSVAGETFLELVKKNAAQYANIQN